MPSLSADIVLLSLVVKVYVFESTDVVKDVYCGIVIAAGLLSGNICISISAFDYVYDPGV